MKLTIEFKGRTECWESHRFTTTTPDGVWEFGRGTNPTVWGKLNGGTVPVAVLATLVGPEDKGPHIMAGYAAGFTHLIMQVEADPSKRIADTPEELAAARKKSNEEQRATFLSEHPWLVGFLTASYAAGVNPLPHLRKVIPGQWDFFSNGTVYAPGIALPVWKR